MYYNSIDYHHSQYHQPNVSAIDSMTNQKYVQSIVLTIDIVLSPLDCDQSILFSIHSKAL